MKTSTVVLVTSLAANVVLCGFIAKHRLPSSATRRAPADDASSAQDSRSRGSDTPGGFRGETSGPGVAPSVASSGDLWSRIDSDDLVELGKRLRAAGFPIRAVRQVIWDLASARAEIARAAIQGKTSTTPYWKMVPYFPDDPAARSRIQEVNAQLRETYRRYSVLNPEMIAEDEVAADEARGTFGNLPVEKLQRLAKIQSDYFDLRTEITRAWNDGPSRDLAAAEREKLVVLMAEERRDLQRALTPDEFEQYELRSSGTSRNLRYTLDLFQPTEAEFKALYALNKEIEDRFQYTGYSDPKIRAAVDEAKKGLSSQIAAALGTERYAEYLQAMDPAQGKINRLMADLNLPLSTAGKIDAVRTAITQRADVIRADLQLSPDERDARLSVLAQEAQASVTTRLGARGYSAYAEMKASDWLRALRPTASKP